MSNYSERLKDPRWQKKRLEILNRDHWTCQHCGSTKKELQVHHVEYIKGLSPWEHPDSKLQTLCADCHKKLYGLRNGSVKLTMHGFSYDGLCPQCGSDNMKDKGSWDKCMDCGFSVSFYPN